MILTKENTLTFFQSDGNIYFLLVSPPVVLEKILKLARLKPGDSLYDLGSGDGRIIIEAAQKYGVKAIGIESNRELVEHSKKRIDELGLQRLVQVVHDSFYLYTIGNVDVVVLYVGPTDISREMKFDLRQKLEDGSRIITVNLIVPEWALLRTEKVSDGHNIYFIYLYQKSVPGLSFTS